MLSGEGNPERKMIENPPEVPQKVILVDEKEAARMLGYTIRALQSWRLQGRGPKFVRVSAKSIRYRVQDLESWAAARLVQSTSEKLPGE